MWRMRMYMTSLMLRLTGVKHLIRGEYYSFRKTAIWLEAKYKRGMLKRIQSYCVYFFHTVLIAHLNHMAHPGF